MNMEEMSKMKIQIIICKNQFYIALTLTSYLLLGKAHKSPLSPSE